MRMIGAQLAPAEVEQIDEGLGRLGTADIDGDGTLNSADIPAFVDLLTEQ